MPSSFDFLRGNNRRVGHVSNFVTGGFCVAAASGFRLGLACASSPCSCRDARQHINWSSTSRNWCSKFRAPPANVVSSSYAGSNGAQIKRNRFDSPVRFTISRSPTITSRAPSVPSTTSKNIVFRVINDLISAADISGTCERNCFPSTKNTYSSCLLFVTISRGYSPTSLLERNLSTAVLNASGCSK
jgi:hypothetical protein